MPPTSAPVHVARRRRAAARHQRADQAPSRGAGPSRADQAETWETFAGRTCLVRGGPDGVRCACCWSVTPHEARGQEAAAHAAARGRQSERRTSESAGACLSRSRRDA